MKRVCTPNRSSQFLTAFAVNSGPLSDRMNPDGESYRLNHSKKKKRGK
tara:strand:+ start:61 stop:204 length:144 start_codon:yes stop_codon:yes gene_type:complete